MATGGMGDVLSGIIGALLARKALADWVSDEKRNLPPILYRTATAAYIHGLAGDRAAEKVGEYSLIASDLLKTLPEIIKDTL
jgi:NAD(P)H-hydrate epimerase